MLLQPVAPAGVVIHPYASAAFGEDSRKALPDILAVPCQSHAIWLAAGALAHQRLVGCRGRTSESLLEPASGFGVNALDKWAAANLQRSEEHTSELQSLMRISYAVFCLKK